MKNAILIALCSILFISCSPTYYYSKLSTNNNDVFQTPEGDFVVENDSLYVIYSFFGENNPVNIGVYNKTNQGLFVDWAKSVVLTEGTGYLYNNLNEQNSLPISLAYVPPGTQINYTSDKLVYYPFDKIPKNQFKKQDYAKSYKVVKVNKAEYSEKESPLRFCSSIVVYDGDPGETTCNKMVFNHSFYMLSLMKTKREVQPEDMMEYIAQQGDFSYKKYVKKNTFWRVLGYIGAGIFIISWEILSGEAY